MHLVLMLTGSYSQDEFALCCDHLSHLRAQHDDIGIDMLVGPSWVASRLRKAGHTVKLLPVKDFMTYDINNSSSTLN